MDTEEEDARVEGGGVRFESYQGSEPVAGETFGKQGDPRTGGGSLHQSVEGIVHKSFDGFGVQRPRELTLEAFSGLADLKLLGGGQGDRH
jgi:hypothetical protein